MSKQQRKITRLGWQIQEQQYLKKLYEAKGIRSWKHISQQMSLFNSQWRKTPKQCRDRYTNHIKFQSQQINVAGWSADEDFLLFHKYMQIGSRWVEISKFIHYRSENQIKNRFYGACRKLIRKINQTLKESKQQNKNRKPIKQSSIFKLLETVGTQQAQKKVDEKEKEYKQNFITNLKYQCLRLVAKIGHEIDLNQIKQITQKIYQFNVMTRFGGMRKARQLNSSKRKSFPPLLIPKKIVTDIKYQNQQEKPINLFLTSQRPTKVECDDQNKLKEAQAIQNELFHFQEFGNQDVNLSQQQNVADLECQLSLILGIQYQPKDQYIL